MKALILDAPNTLRYGEVQTVGTTADDVLVRVQAAGISAIDVRQYQRAATDVTYPRLLGHEVAGLVVGGDLDGTRVVVNPQISCGECSMCATGRTNLCPDRKFVSGPPLSGAIAEFISVPVRNILQLPDAVPFTTACLIEPLARGWHVARMSRRAFPRGRDALVIGDCAIGVGAKLALHAQGIEAVTIIGTDEMEGLSTFDIILDVTCTPASRALASRCVSPAGVIGYLGKTQGGDGLDLNRLCEQEVTVMCTCGYTALDFHDTAAAVFDGRLGALDWADVRPLSEGPAVFDDILKGRIDAPRVVLVPDVA